MHRMKAAAVPFLLLVAVLLMPAPSAEAGESKTLADKNLTWTLPDGWGWLEVAEPMKGAGFVLATGGRTGDAYVLAEARVIPADGAPPLDELTTEVRDWWIANLGTAEGSRIDKGKLSGLEATLAIVKGKNTRDEPALIRVYSVIAEGLVHQVLIRMYNGAETKMAHAVEQLRRGYRLIKGAGPQESGDLPSVEPGAGDSEGGGSGQAPTQEGQTLSFPTHNVKWTIPEGSPFGWIRVTEDEGIKSGTLAVARAVIDLPPPTEKPRPGEPEPPKQNIALLELTVEPAPAGVTPSLFVNDTGVQSRIEQAAFDKLDYGRTQAKDDVPIGNVKGSALQMVGSKEGNVVYVRKYVVLLRGKFYIWHGLMVGDRNVDNDLQRPLNDLVKGIEFIETTEWIRGPLAIPGVPEFGAARGRAVGEEKEYSSLGFKAEKPPEMAELDIDAQNSGGNLRLAWEARSEDKQQYCYFDVQSFTQRSLREGNVKLEDLIQQRENIWKQNAKSTQTIAKGKEPWYRDKFGRGKGLGYEFTGYAGDYAFVEYGYVVEYKDYVYWVRIQFGGKDAEKHFSKLLRALNKALKMG